MKAIYFGTFAPLHKGHINVIINAKRKYESVQLFVSGYTGDRGEQAGMPLYERYRSIREVFKDDKLVTVHKINEDSIPKMPDGWDQWLQAIEEVAGDLSQYVFVCCEQEYVDELQKRNLKADNFTRNEIAISGTEIRSNPLANWSYINNHFKKYFTKKILIYGTASTGKSTLVKDLAMYYSTAYSEEYARHYQIKYNVTDEELDIRDLNNIGLGQYKLNKQHIHSPANNGIFIADTDVMTTYNYLTYYCQDQAYFEEIKNIFKVYIAKQEWDLIIFLKPDIEYVDDGFRDMTAASPQVRLEFHEYFRQTLDEFNCQYLEIGGTYEQRFNQSKNCINKLLAKKGAL